MKKNVAVGVDQFNVPDAMHYEFPKIVYRNSRNARYFEKKYELNFMPSCTIPDQTMSLKEIVENYARGIPYNVLTPQFDDGTDIGEIMPDIRRLDLSEIEDLRANIKAVILAARDEHDYNVKARLDKEKKEADDELNALRDFHKRNKHLEGDNKPDDKG